MRRCTFLRTAEVGATAHVSGCTTQQDGGSTEGTTETITQTAAGATAAELSEEFAKYTHEPAEPVTFTYEELKGNLSAWTGPWAKQFASK